MPRIDLPPIWHAHRFSSVRITRSSIARLAVPAAPAARPGQISLHGLSPLIKAELKWGLHSYSQRSDHTRWWMHAILRVVNACRGLASLADFNVEAAGEHERMIVNEIRRDLEVLYFTPAETKAAGYIDFEHFGRRIGKLNSKFDLTLVPQQWLRDLLRDYLADLLRSVDSPRGRGTYFAIRVAVLELGAFLEARTPDGGHHPAMLGSDAVDQFVADHRGRARDRLTSLRPNPNAKPAIITATTCKSTLDILRKIMRTTFETGRADQNRPQAGVRVRLPRRRQGNLPAPQPLLRRHRASPG